MTFPDTTSFDFWGAVTSTVDWCEANYQHSNYVAEFFNTGSSFAMVLAGTCGFWLHRKILEFRFLLAFLILIVVGLGSAAFHASLRFETQMMDEVPMLYAAIVMVYCVLENQPNKRFGMWFPLSLFMLALVVTALSTFTRGQVQFWTFQLTFGSMEMFGLYRVYRIYQKSQDTTLRQYFRWGLGLYAIAILLWFIDIRFCTTILSLSKLGVPNPQFHALWHILVSAGFYFLLLVVAYDRNLRLGRHPAIARKNHWIPYVEARLEENTVRTGFKSLETRPDTVFTVFHII